MIYKPHSDFPDDHPGTASGFLKNWESVVSSALLRLAGAFAVWVCVVAADPSGGSYWGQDSFGPFFLLHPHS